MVKRFSSTTLQLLMLILVLIITVINCASFFQAMATAPLEVTYQLINLAKSPILGVSVLSIEYYQSQHKWPKHENDLQEVLSVDSLEYILELFDRLSFIENKNRNLEINFVCNYLENDSAQIMNLRGMIDLEPSSAIISDTLFPNGVVSFY